MAAADSPLDRVSQLNMTGHHASCGIWAPNLNWDSGTFYLVYTDVKTNDSVLKDTHNYVVTAQSRTHPGRWSVGAVGLGGFGLCCQDLTGGRCHADFDWFEYEELE